MNELQNMYSNHLNTGLVGYSNGRFVFDCQMVRYLNGGMKTGLKQACLWSKMSGIRIVRVYHLNTGHLYQPVYGPKCPRIRIVRHYHLNTWTPILSDIQVFSIQMVTVHKKVRTINLKLQASGLQVKYRENLNTVGI